MGSRSTKGHKDAPWRGLSVCCAETRLGVRPDIATGRQRSLCLFGSAYAGFMLSPADSARQMPLK
jgi:hypothetical protein